MPRNRRRSRRTESNRVEEEDWPVQSILNWKRSVTGERLFEVQFKPSSYYLTDWENEKKQQADDNEWQYMVERRGNRRSTNPKILVKWGPMWVPEDELSCDEILERFLQTNPAPVEEEEDEDEDDEEVNVASEEKVLEESGQNSESEEEKEDEDEEESESSPRPDANDPTLSDDDDDDEGGDGQTDSVTKVGSPLPVQFDVTTLAMLHGTSTAPIHSSLPAKSSYTSQSALHTNLHYPGTKAEDIHSSDYEDYVYFGDEEAEDEEHEAGSPHAVDIWSSSRGYDVDATATPTLPSNFPSTTSSPNSGFATQNKSPHLVSITSDSHDLPPPPLTSSIPEPLNLSLPFNLTTLPSEQSYYSDSDSSPSRLFIDELPLDLSQSSSQDNDLFPTPSPPSPLTFSPGRDKSFKDEVLEVDLSTKEPMFSSPELMVSSTTPPTFAQFEPKSSTPLRNLPRPAYAPTESLYSKLHLNLSPPKRMLFQPEPKSPKPEPILPPPKQIVLPPEPKSLKPEPIRQPVHAPARTNPVPPSSLKRKLESSNAKLANKQQHSKAAPSVHKSSRDLLLKPGAQRSLTEPPRPPPPIASKRF